MVVFFRAVVMLAVLVGLPAAWIYYGPLPSGAQRAVDRAVEVVRNATGWQQPTAETVATKAAPRFSVAAAPAPKFSSHSARHQSAQTQSTSLMPTTPTPMAQTDTMPTATGLAEQMEPLLERLRALGSTEYSLEPWGREGEFFRFRCAMPLAQDKQFTQQFEAVAETPRASIEQVVSEVTRWQTARLDQQRYQ
ncbi:MAG: hypothetical protein IH898_09170 [Planctomycetes bacterium]|nr:hypothetical protein [Planctomycetota bacterium]